MDSRSEREPRRSKKSARKTPALPSIEQRIRNVRIELDGDVASWVQELEATGAALRHDSTGRKQEAIEQAISRLERLANTLRLAPDGLEQSLRGRIVPLASTGAPFEDAIRGGKVTEEELAVANAELRRRIFERNRVEKKRQKDEQGLRELQAQFESAFANAPIGMALVDLEGRWLQVNDALCRITGPRRAGEGNDAAMPYPSRRRRSRRGRLARAARRRGSPATRSRSGTAMP